MLGEAPRQGGGTAHGHVPRARVERDGLERAVAAEHRRGALRAPPRDAGDPVGAVADEGEQVRDRGGGHAVLGEDPRLVEHDVAHAIPRDDALADHALAEVLVRRGEHHALDARVAREARGRGGDGVVGLEVDHRPDDDAERSAGALRELELAEQIGVDPLARLVAVEERVSKRLDHVIERDAEVRDLLAREQALEAAYERAHGADLAPRRRARARRAEEHAEQLVRPVEEVDVQAHLPLVVTTTVFSSWMGSCGASAFAVRRSSAFVVAWCASMISVLSSCTSLAPSTLRVGCGLKCL